MADCTITGCKRCKTIQQYKLDTYTSQFVLPTSEPLLLSIDVEGFDWDVLLGILKHWNRSVPEFRVQLERLLANNQTLSTAFRCLKEEGFVCYWAGSSGKPLADYRLLDGLLRYGFVPMWRASADEEAVPVHGDSWKSSFLETLAV
jgi:hypothetical protein